MTKRSPRGSFFSAHTQVYSTVYVKVFVYTIRPGGILFLKAVQNARSEGYRSFEVLVQPRKRRPYRRGHLMKKAIIFLEFGFFLRSHDAYYKLTIGADKVQTMSRHIFRYECRCGPGEGCRPDTDTQTHRHTDKSTTSPQTPLRGCTSEKSWKIHIPSEHFFFVFCAFCLHTLNL